MKLGAKDVELLQAIGARGMRTSNRTRGRVIHHRTADRLAGLGLVVVTYAATPAGYRGRAELTDAGMRAAGLQELELE